MTTEIKNAVIESAALEIEDHDQLTVWLTLDYGGAGQGFGGYSLCSGPHSKHYPGDRNYAGIFIRRVLDIAGVRRWSDLKGKTIRVRGEAWGSVEAIGHIVKDDWFCPATDLRAPDEPAEQSA